MLKEGYNYTANDNAAEDLAILVLSCDKYSDVWPSFYKCFKENFPSICAPIYLGSNTLKANLPGVITLFSGKDVDWSSSYRKILSQIKERKVFVILEDLFLDSKIDKTSFESIIRFLFEADAKHIRYWGDPRPDFETCNSLVGGCLKGAPYRATVCGFWDRDYLLSLIIDGENPWNFEILGSYRTSYDDGFFATHSSICSFKNMIEKGCWIKKSIKWALEHKIPLDISARPALNGFSQAQSVLQMIFFRGMLSIPWKLRVNLMNYLRKIFISY